MLGRCGSAPHLLILQLLREAACSPLPARPMDSTTEHAPDIRRWLPAAYFLGFVLFASPVLETFGALWPPHFDAATWRYGAVGIFLSSVGSAPLGLLCMLVAAVVLRHQLALRLIGIAAILMTLFVLTVCGAFALDVIQVRSIVRPAVQGGFDLAAAKAVLMGLVVMVTCILIAVAAFKAAAPGAGHRSPRRGRSSKTDQLVGAPDGPLE